MMMFLFASALFLGECEAVKMLSEDDYKRNCTSCMEFQTSVFVELLNVAEVQKGT